MTFYLYSNLFQLQPVVRILFGNFCQAPHPEKSSLIKYHHFPSLLDKPYPIWKDKSLVASPNLVCPHILLLQAFLCRILHKRPQNCPQFPSVHIYYSETNNSIQCSKDACLTQHVPLKYLAPPLALSIIR